jgi:predicted RNA-binding protein YlqC (UPF0109 family)
MNTSIDQQFVEFVVKSLVGNPDAVSVERRIDEKGVLLELTVDPEDLGRVIGKRGATAQSLRTLLRALGTKNEARYNLKIIDNGVEHEQAPVTVADDNAAVVEDDVPSPMSNSDGDLDDDSDDTQSTQVSDDERDRMARHRRDLAELDDLDV